MEWPKLSRGCENLRHPTARFHLQFLTSKFRAFNCRFFLIFAVLLSSPFTKDDYINVRYVHKLDEQRKRKQTLKQGKKKKSGSMKI